jgi:hypothetical protein
MSTWTLEEQKKHRAELVAALRSGKYKQGRHRLRDGSDGYCCLGVACDVAYPDMWNGNVHIAGSMSSSSLTAGVQAYYGFRTPNAGFTYPLQDQMGYPVGWCDSLVSCNDGIPKTVEGKYTRWDDDQMPFNHIADLIEYEMPDMFEDETADT